VRIVEHIGQLTADLETLVRHYGVFAVSLILAFEALGAPVPGETLLIFASVLAQRGEMSLPGLLIFAWAGSVVGDNVGYLIGRTLGRATIARYGAKIGLTDARISAIERIFSRYGSATVLFARFFSILRQLNGIVAGTLRMPWWRFLLFNAIGAALWVAVWVFTTTYFAGHTAVISRLAHHTEAVATIVVIVCIITVISLVVRRLRGKRGHRSE
jgi:membrane protein DedA with SNARE-associated domain